MALSSGFADKLSAMDGEAVEVAVLDVESEREVTWDNAYAVTAAALSGAPLMP